MLTLFQEMGPCRIKNDSSDVTLNPYSWNNNANVMFIDQPIGTGFSHGPLKVHTSKEAASDVWDFMQIWMKDERFAHLQANDLAIWTSSYGGHYGPAFAAFFLAQNDAIAAGSVDGLPLNLKVLGIGDGMTDPLRQYGSYARYATENPYYRLVNDSVIETANETWTRKGGCQEMINTCYANGTDAECIDAQLFCNENILRPLFGPYDVYYVLTVAPDPYPPNITDYIYSIADTIGAEHDWQITNDDVGTNFQADWMRNSGLDLQTVIEAGVRTLIYVGDVDYILNYIGVEAQVDALNTTLSAAYHADDLAPYTVNGIETGLYKQVGDTEGISLAFLRMYGAGHQVPAYGWNGLDIGQAALQMFSQVMGGEGLKST
ncbi:Alpha/Beta hydrolase protein [Schizophyllum amplum]|uniref:Alpha/Beta hydrolase protein n=1 Tax=Schizophyllum amplum TaxID=97359 RepID=A0A550CXF7_9AGAR|nr:Alpha/Beta hydrolase protein [Auriculariopsis ampla]